MRIVVLGGGFAGLEAIRCLELGLRRRDDIFPRDSAIIRPPERCPICARPARVEERRAA